MCVYHKDLYSSRYLDTEEFDLTYTKIQPEIAPCALVDMGTQCVFTTKICTVLDIGTLQSLT
jgi:hypothetical protein